MRRKDRENELTPESQLKILHRHLTRGIVEGGYCGELIARFLLMRAACVCGFNRSLRAQTNHISLMELLRGLDVENLIVNEDRPEILESGQVHLSRWIQVQAPITMQMIVLAYTRGAGIVCRAGTYGIDLVVPVYLGDKDELSSIKLSRAKSDGSRPISAEENKVEYGKVCKLFSAVFVQVKNSQNSTLADENIKNSRENMRIHAHGMFTKATPREQHVRRYDKCRLQYPISHASCSIWSSGAAKTN